MNRLGMDIEQLIVTFCDRTYGETLEYPHTITLGPRAFSELCIRLGSKVRYKRIDKPAPGTSQDAILLACGTRIVLAESAPT